MVQDEPDVSVIKGKQTPCCHAQRNSQSSIGLMSYTCDLIWYMRRRGQWCPALHFAGRSAVLRKMGRKPNIPTNSAPDAIIVNRSDISTSLSRCSKVKW